MSNAFASAAADDSDDDGRRRRRIKEEDFFDFKQHKLYEPKQNIAAAENVLRSRD